jgi:hypothetical protein
MNFFSILSQTQRLRISNGKIVSILDIALLFMPKKGWRFQNTSTPMLKRNRVLNPVPI